MPSLSIFCGVLLILIGILGYAHGVMTGRASYTALIPTIFGALLLLFGLIARAKENLRKHLMHAAVVVALLGFIATAARLIPRLGELTFSGAEIAQISMAAVCLLFVVLAVKSFVGARRKV
ncbi:MAG: hypothetical protein ACREVH_12290 [Gammaproteobacteria bacterium]